MTEMMSGHFVGSPEPEGCTDGLVLLLTAMVQRAQRDLVSRPRREGLTGSNSIRPSAQEQIEAQEFLRWCEREFAGGIRRE